jgi:hypothetical protein
MALTFEGCLILMWLFLLMPFRNEIIGRLFRIMFNRKSRYFSNAKYSEGSGDLSVAYIGMLDE